MLKLDRPLMLPGRLKLKNRVSLARFGHLEGRQRQDKVEVVVGGDPVMALDATTEAPMHDGIFAVRSNETGDWRHRRTTGARAVAHGFRVDVARIKAHRTMIAVSPSRGKGTDQLAAVPTTEVPGFLGPKARRTSVRISLPHN